MNTKQALAHTVLPLSEALVIRCSFVIVAIMLGSVLRVFSGRQAVVPCIFSIPVLLVHAWFSFGGGVPKSVQTRVKMSRVEFLGVVAFISLTASVLVGAALRL
jgi:hypothetical protein